MNNFVYDLAVLIVEDDAPSRIFAQNLLKLKVRECFAGTNGEEGLELFMENRPEIVITDIGMPFMNGLDMSRKILEAAPKTRIILTTAFDSKEYLMEAIDLGINHYIVKPVQKKQLFDSLERVMKNILLEREVKNQYEHIRKISKAVEQSPNMVIILNRDNNIEYVNPRFLNVTGYNFIEVQDNSYDILKSDSPLFSEELFYEFQFAIANNNEWHGEFYFSKKNNDHFWASVSVSAVFDTLGDKTHTVILLEDISAKKIAQEQLQKAHDELEMRVEERTLELKNTNDQLRSEIDVRKRTEEELRQAKEAAEAANRAKGSFLAKMSHELRTPMNGIIGLTSILLGTELTEKQENFLTMVKTSADNLLKIINDILDLSRIESGKIPFQFIHFKLRDTIEQTVALFQAEARKKGLELKYYVNNDVPQDFIGDPGRIQQILINLIGNAIKFTDEGSVSVQVQNRALHSTAIDDEICEDKAELFISVRDTGIGIPEDKIKLLFKSFSQVDGSYTRKYGGTGLGLKISKELVEMMEGKIWVESKTDIGSSFNFTIQLKLPKEITADNQVKPDKSELDLSKIASEYPDISLNILVAEDSLINQEVIKQVLIEKNWDVVTVSDGLEAVEAFKSGNFDLIFMDVQMPNVDGLEATMEIRDIEKLQGGHIPIIGLTAHAYKIHEDDCINAGMDAFISKPFKWNEIFDIIFQYSGKEANQNTTPTGSVNIKGLLEALGNKTDVLANISRYFIDNYPGELSKLQDAISEKDYDETCKIAHKMKSEIGNFGAEKAVKLAAEIEYSGKQQYFDNIQELIEQFEQELDEMRKILSEFINKCI